jgi:Domain of unknown function (DUF4157)
MSNRSTATITTKEKSSVMPMRSSLIQRKCACGNSAGMAGECRDCQNKSLVQRKSIDQDNTSEIPPIAHEFPIQTKLTVGKPGDIYEQEADRVATQVMSMGNSTPSIQPARAIGKKEVQTKRSSDGESQAGSNIESRLSSSKGGGSPLPDDVRSFMEPRFDSDFNQVRVHTDTHAIQMNRDLNSQAFTHQQDVYFGLGNTPQNDTLTAHELTHVVQQNAANKISPYRSKKAFNFGTNDTSTLKEETFTNSKKQPWIEQINVEYTGVTTDSNKELAPNGTLEAVYNGNAVALPTIKNNILGGSTSLGLTDKGKNFTVTRIEGIGYNDVPQTKQDGEGPHLKYSKPLNGKINASMHYAIFFRGIQAIHIGSLTEGSHACVHAGDDATAYDKMQQINYHSVVGKTVVNVSYDSGSLATLCCSRMKILGAKKKGDAPNPCSGSDPKTCP